MRHTWSCIYSTISPVCLPAAASNCCHIGAKRSCTSPSSSDILLLKAPPGAWCGGQRILLWRPSNLNCWGRGKQGNSPKQDPSLELCPHPTNVIKPPSSQKAQGPASSITPFASLLLHKVRRYLVVALQTRRILLDSAWTTPTRTSITTINSEPDTGTQIDC